MSQPSAVEKPNCYECKHRRELAGDCHSRCTHPNALPAIAGLPVMKVRGNPHGVRNGWFMWPFNFDPVWLVECSGFEPKVEVAQ